ncbi:hypothetical protein [bacterium endosymbiont of Bathymodiolus sp. 5 South]|jgi:hypothetical protein|uniref:hypothetical protein n=1 Tax=bacterium endosymbiont of Bathymodiolus sp. 5 South TaxID=1181670 RepID=UPI0010B13D36|nr:hypothetical protein [bacterium endosymbiont of Bathymodiolus sp. 5 South]CAC9645187.1 hypothetical protein [uncultured Gammaproteobacteria bacterium]SHN93322.1 hypothetical protein BCLUESOX_516 [bacterium endosymbiont of Bathymodiolus sp. 5 South]VVH55509.1 hypothetical protein BSPCLSOX_314 [uncultured Gammaproteobacteria bacterium]VVH62006.1 hypothetical protein BSPWISOX_2672 [uncultured Gammaproteobacteria bacterium]VVM20162.1 hypothetical protein BSPWISOXPB_2379 [uncultured Gammaproteob
MKNKSILAIMLVTTMGFVNAGIFDDIGNGIAGAADDVADFTVNAAEDTADFVVEVAEDTAVVIFNGVTTVGNAMNGDDLRHNWIQKDN